MKKNHETKGWTGNVIKLFLVGFVLICGGILLIKYPVDSFKGKIIHSSSLERFDTADIVVLKELYTIASCINFIFAFFCFAIAIILIVAKRKNVKYYNSYSELEMSNRTTL